MMTPVLAAALLVSPLSAGAQEQAAPGVETMIPDVAGGFRVVEPEGDGSVILVQTARTMRWYRLTLTGPCVDRGAAVIVLPASPGGRIDRFARVASSRMPGRVCGVTSIVTAAAPVSKKPAR